VLVFTRKRDEAIVIGDGVEVRVLRIGRDTIRLGVTAPTTVPVHRLEIYEQIRAENHRAAEVLRSPGTLQAVRKHTIKGEPERA
jgi:carbon storage regulator